MTHDIFVQEMKYKYNVFMKLSLFIIFLLSSCSSGQKSSDLFLHQALDNIKLPENKTKQINTQFKDKTVQYGLENIKAYNFNVVDVNQDGFSDIVVLPSFFSEPVFYYFNPYEKRFRKGKSIFPKSVKASFLMFYDIDNDTVLDVLVGVLNQKTELSKQPIRIFKGQLSKRKTLGFKELNLKIPPSSSSTISLIDYNLDGNLDLFIGNWFKRYKNNPIPSHDLLFTWDKGEKKYVNKTELLISETKMNPDQSMFVNATPTYGSQVCDMDQNGYPDILTTSTNRYRNKLWLNRYKFRTKLRYFSNVALPANYASDSDGLINNQGGGRSFGIACADYNNDKIMDVFIGELTHNYDHQGVDRSSILTGRTLSKNPRFYRTEYLSDSTDPNWHQADRRAIWVDINNDGLLDLVVDNSGYPPHSKLIIFKQLPDHSFQNYSKELGVDIVNPTATVIADFNKDGKMDLLTSRTNIRDDSISQRVFLFENEVSNTNRSLRFILRGDKSNYHGLNSMIIVRSLKMNKVIERRHFVTYSHGALPPQNEEGIHFGIPVDEEVLEVIVRWPYSKNLNKVSSTMEKKYKFKKSFFSKSVILCESGKSVFQKADC